MNLINKILFFFTFTSKIKTFLFIISNFLISLLELIGLSLIVPLLIVIFQPEQAVSSSLLKNFSNIISQNFTPSFIILIIFLIYLLKSIFFILLTNWKLKFMNQILIKISKNLLNNYLRSTQKYFNSKSSGEFLRNTTSETSKVIKLLSASADLLFDVTLLFTAIIFLSFVNIKPTIIIFIFLFIFVLIYFFFLKGFLIKIEKKILALQLMH